MRGDMRLTLRVRHTSLGGQRDLSIEHYPGANDDVRIGWAGDTPPHDRMHIGREDVPKLIAALQAIMVVYPVKES